MSKKCKSIFGIRSGLACLVTPMLLITACGGGSSGGENPPVAPIVDQTSTDDLIGNAALNIGGSLDSSLDGASRVTSASDTVGSDGFDDPASTGLGGLWSEDAQSLVNTSLSLGSEENTTREGSRIIIDPDDAEVCSEEFVDMSATDAEFQRCQALVSDMIVQLDATTDTEGTVTYLFQNQPMVTMGYSDISNSFELNLGTLKLLIDAEDDLDPDGITDSPLDTLQGALRLSAEVTNSTLGSEAGSVALQVSQPISIASADADTSFSLGVGTILALAADAAAENATMEIEVGALQLRDSSEEVTNDLSLAGLTAVIDFANNADQLVVRNLGIGDGPLRIAVDNNEFINFGLDTFGFNIASDDTGEEPVITLTGELNLSALVRGITDDGEISDTLFGLLEITAPAGTQIADQLNGSLGVLSGGPVGYSLTTQDESGNQVIDQLTVNAGQCADDIGDFDSDYEVVACQ